MTYYDRMFLSDTHAGTCRLCGRSITVSYGQGECICCGDGECEHARRKAAEDADHD